MSIINLEGLEFHSYHGCLEHEKKLGNTFIIDVSMELDTSVAGKSDALDDTLNYQLVYDEINLQMGMPSNLIEHVSQRIIDSLFLKFPSIHKLTIKLSKLNPPLGGKVERVSILLTKEKIPIKQ